MVCLLSISVYEYKFSEGKNSVLVTCVWIASGTIYAHNRSSVSIFEYIGSRFLHSTMQE